MSSNIISLINSCQRKCKFNDAFVILYHISTSKFKIRKAMDYNSNRKQLIQYLDSHSLVIDPKKPSDEPKYRIVFYGDKESADDLWERFCQENTENYSNNYSTKRKATTYDGPAKRTRTINEDNYTNGEIISCINRVHSDLGNMLGIIKKLDEKIDDLKRENRENVGKNGIGRDDNSNELGELLENCHRSMKMLNRDKYEFDRKFSNLELETFGLSEKAIDSIRHTLRHERYPGKLVADVCLNLFGEKLKTHILGTDGKRERARRPGEREFVFSKEEEGELRKILSIFGKSFVNSRAWKLIVQASANQKGRDLKNKPPKKFNVEDESEITSDLSALLENQTQNDSNSFADPLNETISRQKNIETAFTQEENEKHDD